MTKIWEVVRKEWSEVFKNRFVLFTVAFMPLLFTAMPLIFLYTMKDSGDAASVMGVSEIPEGYAALCGGLSGLECGQYFIVSQFLVLFLMMPIIIPVTIGAYSIVGEKTTRTLEPLLATPITTIELLMGKALAASIPALGATWVAYAIFTIGTLWMTGSENLVGLLLAPMWLLAIFVAGPLLSVAGVSTAVMVSSRVNDPRVAEQLSALVILPLLAIFFGQSYGLIQIDQNVVVWFVLVLAIIDTALLYFATLLFQRETILTRWK